MGDILRGNYYHEGMDSSDPYNQEPTLEDQMIYEAEQKQAYEWRRAGLCQGCGKEPVTPTGYCEPCMDEIYADYVAHMEPDDLEHLRCEQDGEREMTDDEIRQATEAGYDKLASGWIGG